MGKERATSMMSLLPPVGWGEVATKRDLDDLAAITKRDLDDLAAITKRDLDAHATAFRHELHTQIASVRSDFDALGARLDAKFDGVATKVELHELHLSMQKTFVTWMFASQAAVIAAMGVSLALFR